MLLFDEREGGFFKTLYTQLKEQNDRRFRWPIRAGEVDQGADNTSTEYDHFHAEVRSTREFYVKSL